MTARRQAKGRVKDRRRKARPPRGTDTARDRWSSELSMQLAVGTLSFLLLLGLAALLPQTFATHRSTAAESLPEAAITLEHVRPLSLTLLIARKGQSGYASVTNGSDEQIQISLPASWTRLEVSGTLLKHVTAELSADDTLRWTLPAHAGLKLSAPIAPGSLHLTNTSTQTVAVAVQTVDLATDSVKKDVLLVKETAELPLWRGD